MAQFTIYKSTDASAPVLTGEVGSLVALLKACLVDGYGVKAAAGWTRPYSGTDKAAFRSGAGTQFYFRVQDDAPVTAKEARINGFETMSDVDTGTGQFPAAGGFGTVRKSNAADATAKVWIIVADTRTVYGFVITGDSAGIYTQFAFGDIYSLLAGDAYHCILIGRITENTSSTANEGLCSVVGSISDQVTGNYIARGYTGTGGPVLIGKHTDTSLTGAADAFIGVVPYPNPSDGAAILGRVWVHDPVTTPVKNLRGRMRGLWVPFHAISSFTNGDIVTGSGELAGKTFLIIKTVNSASGVAGVVAIETSNTLETN